MKALLSIDPGKGGAVALFVDSRPVWVEKWTDEFEMSDLILDAQNQYAELSAVIENVHSMPGQGVVSMFSFGENYGIWRGILIALGIPHERVSPQKWQQGYGVGMHKKQAKKQALCRIAKEHFPQLKPTLKTADALLIGEWATQNKRRINAE